MRLALYHSTIACLSALLLVAQACKKPGNAVSGGGKGGHSVIYVTPEHHGLFVDSCTIYVKYGTNDAPASGLYDDSARCVLNDTTPVAAFTGLTAGQYYLFGNGYHSGYGPPQVRGGIPCTIPKDYDTMAVYLPAYTY